MSSGRDLNASSEPKRLLIGLLLFALAVRGGVLLMPDALRADPDNYRRLAENLLEHGTLGEGNVPTAYRPPLYPLVLAGCLALGDWSRVTIGLVHLLLGLATVWMVFLLAKRWGLGRYALVAAGLVACDPILLAQSALLMSETLATFLVVAALLCLTSAVERPTVTRAAAAGAAAAVVALCRPGLLLWTLASAVVLPAFVRPSSMRLKIYGAFVIAAAVVLAPWAVRNQARFGRPILTTTHGGYTLLLGNNPWFYEYLRSGPWGSVWDADELHRSRTNPADEVRAEWIAYAEACRSIFHEPGMFLYACAVRVGRLWQPLPHQVHPDEGPLGRLVRYAVGLWYLAEFLLAAAGLWAVWRGGHGEQHARRVWFWGLLLAGCMTAVHTVYWTNMRMRAPLMPVVALAAAAGIAWVESRRHERKSFQE